MQVRLKKYVEGGPRCNHCKDYNMKEEFSHRTQICQCKKLKAHEHTATKSEHRHKHTCKHITSEWQQCATQAWHTQTEMHKKQKKYVRQRGPAQEPTHFTVPKLCWKKTNNQQKQSIEPKQKITINPKTKCQLTYATCVKYLKCNSKPPKPTHDTPTPNLKLRLWKIFNKIQRSWPEIKISNQKYNTGPEVGPPLRSHYTVPKVNLCSCNI